MDKKRKKGRKTFPGILEKVCGILEIIVAIIVLLGFCIAAIPLLRDMPGLLDDTNEYTFHIFLEHAFNLVIGIEFIRMLVKHTPGSALEVLMFAIARHLVLDGGSGIELLLSVLAIGGIFAIRRYLYVHSFEGEIKESGRNTGREGTEDEGEDG